ncbi:FMN-dependent NADH-azoreductase [Actinomadura verrucosospora]|uniref:FMN dependent NADH:quinone oxidoreductase n=1 Tax=Actinomadura verrucosospora TaxID=46165 RepID=A0A7D4A8P4_ACTVE|nr:NAD(P)H-dependent oxidoreductase [Actinomadura verrucosospora]QKG24107.1 NAD(P)H dehydrogenase (quinone) [Actinomadura verrucosospora]
MLSARDQAASLLHLDSSHSGDSVTRRLSARFADAWRERHGPSGHRYRDLAADPVPPISPAYCALGRRVEKNGYVPPAKVDALIETEAEEREWALTLPLIERFTGAGTVLIGAPMYNFSVPASLKAWIDRITFPGAFTDPDTGESVLRDKRIVVVTARGGAYGPGTPREGFDFQEPYLRAYFGGLGVAEDGVTFVNAEMTLADLVPHLARFRGMAAESLAEAREAVVALASR